MSEAKGQNDKRPNDEGAGPTRSFDSSVTGPGSQIGPFRIERELGRGAVGVVYLAHDTKLDREVAIKSLPAEVMANPKARSRFTREARVLASLNHPNIATIYEEFQEAEDVAYLILEYVPGQTLAEHIAKKPLKLEEALSITLQIAEAVAAAHEHDVIHRDLKPGNIKITPEGKVKVLDFGLAKAVGSEAVDQQSTVTEPGRVIGTPAYMSPEQARGKPADKRSDIWSFGCVLYEMLTGRLPFKGETISDTLANILQTDPNWQALPQDTPANIQVLLRRCLEKNPRRRLQHIGDAAIEISETLSLLTTASSATTPAPVLFKAEVTGKPKLRTVTMIIGAAIIIVLSAIAVRFIPRKQTQRPSKEIRLVVLPFENLGSAEDEYFADGIAEEIMSRLSAIRTLGVISRTSAIRYKNSSKTIQQIGDELGVEYVLEGTVRWDRPSEGPSRVRVTPQLIRVPDDTHLWSERYDAVLANIFEVQSDIAEQVAKALDITLLEPERRTLASRPTENMEAYDYYLQGNNYWYRQWLGYSGQEVMVNSVEMYEKAVELDPNFALAWARLARVHLRSYAYWRTDPTPERLEQAQRSLDHALALDPGHPEVILAHGYYYYWTEDYRQALEYFQQALKKAPNNGEILGAVGIAHRRLGEWETAISFFKPALQSDPRHIERLQHLAGSYCLLRRWREAEHYADLAIQLEPESNTGYNLKMQTIIGSSGDLQKMRQVLAQGGRHGVDLRGWELLVDTYAGNYQEAVDRIQSYDDLTDIWQLQLATLYRLMGRPQQAAAHYDSARIVYEAQVAKDPGHPTGQAYLGQIYAGLGRRDEALRQADIATTLKPVEKDALGGTSILIRVLPIYILLGDYDRAFDLLEQLLSIPSVMNLNVIRLEPDYKPLREHPRYAALVEKYGGK
jgi:serine/threonine protein kinase/tetratricopeptide (TPR) repeat protein